MKQRLSNMYIKNKTILIRCDFNVPIKDNIILDDTKIKKSLETINYCLKENCKIILLSHLGRVKTEEDKINNSLKPVKDILEKLINKPILFASDLLSEETKTIVTNMQPGEILLLENTRFLDVPNNLESTCNDEIAKQLASLGDIFVMDAFASAHRAHTSVVGIAKYIPSCIGFLVEKEIELLDSTIKNPEHPFTVIMGGAKVDDKLEIIKSLLPKCDHLLLGGGLANSFLYALGINTGSSLRTENNELLNDLRKLMLDYKNKFALPLDAIVSLTFSENSEIKNINKLDSNDYIKDIGVKTINKYKTIINESKTIFVNGTMGIYEEKEYRNGSIELFNILKESNANIIIGGGDTIAAINSLGFSQDFKNISSGGGATLEYIAKGSLPGIDAIKDEDEIEVLDL